MSCIRKKESQVDIRAVTISDTTQFGILRIIVDQPHKAEEALKKQGFTFCRPRQILSLQNTKQSKAKSFI